MTLTSFFSVYEERVMIFFSPPFSQVSWRYYHLRWMILILISFSPFFFVFLFLIKLGSAIYTFNFSLPVQLDFGSHFSYTDSTPILSFSYTDSTPILSCFKLNWTKEPRSLKFTHKWNFFFWFFFTLLVIKRRKIRLPTVSSNITKRKKFIATTLLLNGWNTG